MKKIPKVREKKNWFSILFRYRYAFVFLFTFLVYANTIFNDYNLDDELVTRNHILTSQGLGIDNLQKIFTQPYYQDNMGYSYGYRPLTLLTFTIEHSLFGDNPHISHLINLLLYSLLCLLLLKVLELILVKYDKLIPLATIILFACHPLHTEVVASIKNRDEILSFICASLVFYILFSGLRPFWLRFILSMLFFIAGMLFKPNLIMLPGLLVVALLFFKGEKELYISLLAIIFSIVSVYFLENVSDGLKVLFIISNLVFCFSMILLFKENRPFDYLKNNIIVPDSSLQATDRYAKTFSQITLTGYANYIFLILNVIIAFYGVSMMAWYSNPWIVILLALIYGFESYFIQIKQLRPVIFFFLAHMFINLNWILLPSALIIAPIIFKKKRILYINLVIALFLLVFYSLVNMSINTRLFYVISNVVFCIFMILVLKKSQPLDNLKSSIFFPFFYSEITDQSINPPSVILRGYLYYIFLTLNLVMAFGGIYASTWYSGPWIIILIMVIYALEMYFIRLNQLWLIIILFDMMCMFLLFGNGKQYLSPLVKTYFIGFFSAFNISIILDLKKIKFWIAFIPIYLLTNAYLYYNFDPKDLFINLFSLLIIIFIYHRNLYKSRSVMIILYLLAYALGNNFTRLNLLYEDSHKIIFAFTAFVFLGSLYYVSYFKIALDKIVSITAINLVLFIVLLSLFQIQISINAPIIDSVNHKEISTVQTLKSAQQLPSAYNNVKHNRPLTFIEKPVTFDAPTEVYIATSIYQYYRYMLLLVKPWPMSFYYGYKEIDAHHLNEPLIILSAIFFVFLLFSAFYIAWRNKVISFGIFFMLLSILPYLIMIAVIPGMLGDRYTFQSSFGFSIFLASCLFYIYYLPKDSRLLTYFNQNGIRQAVKISFALLVLGYVILSLDRNSQWKDKVTLMRRDVNTVPGSVQAHNLLALNLVGISFSTSDANEQKQLREEAIGHLKIAYSIYKDYFNIPYDIGRIFTLLNMPDSALNYYKKAYLLNPRYSDVSLNIANIYFGKSDFQASIPYYIKLIQDNADNYTAYDKLSYAYFRINQPELSVKVNMDAIKRAPSRPQPYLDIALCYFNINNLDSSKVWFKRALDISPNNPIAINYLQKLK